MAAVVVPTLERIIRDARVLLRQPKAENSRFTDTELTGYANDALQQIFLTVNEAGEGQYDRTPQLLNLVSGTETVALPTDCFAVKALYKVQSGVNRRLEYRQAVTEDMDSTAASNGAAYEPYYFLRGNDIVLRPKPGFSETGGLYIEYTGFPNVLVYGADTMDAGMSPLFKELIVMYIVAKAKLSDDLSGSGGGYQLAASHRDDLFRQFRHQLIERSKAPNYITPYNP